MIKKHQRYLFLLFFGSDTVATIFSFLLAYWARFYTDIIPTPLGIPPLRPYLYLIGVLIPIQYFVFSILKFYEQKRERSRVDETFLIIQGVTLTTLLLAAATFFIRSFSYSRLVIGIYWAIDILLIFIFRRLLWQYIYYLRRKGRNLRRVLIAGAGELGEMVARKIISYPDIGIKIIGFVDDGTQDKDLKVEGLRILGTLNDVRDIVASNGIDQLIIALPMDAHRKFINVVNSLEKELVDIVVVPDILQFISLKASVGDLDGIPIINLSESPIGGWNSFTKRILDLSITLVCVFIFMPLMFLIGIFIKLSSRGPVMFRQERMGLDGKPFMMYKFRSMKMQAEEETGPVWAKKDDPRRTFIGSLIRKTSLDELPQLFNVIKGEMSLVGPRPERPHFVHEFKERVPQYMLRHKVKSGMTGWAQINGWRGNTSIEKRIEYDMYYIENWSLSFDIKILWLTFWRGWTGKHAY